jgi:hypothetical protein
VPQDMISGTTHFPVPSQVDGGTTEELVAQLPSLQLSPGLK